MESDEQNRNRGMDTWNRLAADRGGAGGGRHWMKEGEEIGQRTYLHTPWTQTTVC